MAVGAKRLGDEEGEAVWLRCVRLHASNLDLRQGVAALNGVLGGRTCAHAGRVAAEGAFGWWRTSPLRAMSVNWGGVSFALAASPSAAPLDLEAK